MFASRTSRVAFVYIAISCVVFIKNLWIVDMRRYIRAKSAARVAR